jgi:membrane protein implicated in regulation of membrane protease activity
MSESTLWWLVTGLAVVAELLTGTFVLLMLAIGFAAGALAAHLGAPLTLQLVAAAVVGGGAVVAWQKWRKAHRSEPSSEANRNLNLDIGQTLLVPMWEPSGTARVSYRGAQWTVALQDPAQRPVPGLHRIVAVQGSRLLVETVPTA